MIHLYRFGQQVTDFSAAGLSSKGLTGVLADLHTAFNKMGYSEEEATQQTMVLLNAQRGGLGMSTLLGQGAKDYANNLTAMSDVLAQTHACDLATCPLERARL